MATTTLGSASRATSASDRRSATARLLTTLVCCTSPLALMAQDLPTGGRVAAGNVQIGAPQGAGMTVRQQSDTAIVNWNSFDVGSGRTLRFDQPSTDSTILNRVTGNTGTNIHGRLTANGQVHVVNPNGIFIGPNGMVQAGGGFVASTLDITDEDFKNGTYRYYGDGQSSPVVNAGTIQIGRGGYAALLGGHVNNAGRVTVPMGRVGFASGERVTLDLSGDGFLQVAVPTTADSAEGQALIENAGTVSAEGGRIEMQAATARHAVRNAINLSGVAEASSVSVRGGTIVLGGGAGGQVKVTGRVAARSTKPHQSHAVTSVVRPQARPGTGGTITVAGANIALAGATMDVSGSDGGGLIRVGGDFAGAGALPHASRTAADADTVLRADALSHGDGGRIVLWSDVSTNAAATLSARGGTSGGDGGFIEVSSAETLNYQGWTDTRAPMGDFGMLLLDPRNITVNIGSPLEAAIEDDLTRNDVTLDTSDTLGPAAGNITINTNIDWTTGSTLYLYADNNIRLNAAINGPNGGLDLTAGNTITTGANGRVNVSRFLLYGGDWTQVGTLPAFSAKDFTIYGTFLRAAGGDGNATPYRIVDVYGLQGIGSSEVMLGANYELGADIDASGTALWGQDAFGGYGFQPLAYSESSFTGTFDGNLHTVSGLFIDQHYYGEGVYAENASMFGSIGSSGVVRNLTLTDVDISGYEAGGIASSNSGLITAVSVSGTVAGEDAAAGGLVGANYGTITDSRAAVAVDSISTYYDPGPAGGAIGYNSGTVDRVHATGNVAISDDGYEEVTLLAGGFVGQNDGTIRDSYARGNVTVTSSGGGLYNYINAGGFVGLIGENGVVARSYSTGRINTAIAEGPLIAIGGFAGDSYGPAAPSNVWDVTTSGRTSSAVGVGRTTAQLQNTLGFISFASPRGWEFTGDGAVWSPGEAGRYPSLYATSPVVYAVPTALSVVYGETGTTVAPGTITGGPASYVFDDPADPNFAPSDILGNLTFANTNVGTTSYRIGINQFGYAGSENFRIVDTPATATITPRALTITANDVTKTYGQGLNLGVADVSVAQDNGTSPSGLVAGDAVTAMNVQSDGAAANANATGTPYTITASGATGNGLGNYDITYVDGALTVNRAPLTITGQDQVKAEGDTFTFNGTEFSVSGLVVAGDRVDSALISSDGSPASATAAGSPYVIAVNGATGTRLDNYDITYVDGAMTVTNPAVTPSPPPPTFTLPNPTDRVSTEISLGPITAGGVAGAAGSGVAKATQTLAETRVIADGLSARAQACSSNDQDVSRYLACLSDALNDFASELDAIVADLPPGLANVAQIVQDARQGVDAARARAESRLAGATTAAEREAIRTDAVNEARAAVDTAATEIRKAISLVRVQDPELASVQRETIVAVAAAVDSVSIELSRAVGL